MKRKCSLLFLLICCVFVQSISVLASDTSTKADGISYEIEDTASKDGMGWIFITCDTGIDFYYDVQVTYENTKTGEEKAIILSADTQYRSYENVELGTYQITDAIILNEYADYYSVSYSHKKIEVKAENLSAVETKILIEDHRDEIVKKREEQKIEAQKKDEQKKDEKINEDRYKNDDTNSIISGFMIMLIVLCGLGIGMYIYKQKQDL